MTTPSTRPAAGYRAASATIRIGVRHLLNVDLDVDGLERVPDGGVIVVCNNLSPLDGLAVGLVLAELDRQPLAILSPAEVHHPLFGLLHRAGAIHVGSSEPAYALAREAVWRGRPVIWQPELSPSASLEVGTFRLEASHLAMETEAALLPMALFGTHRLFPTGRFRMQRDIPVGVTFGYTSLADVEADVGITKRLRQDVEVRLDQTLDRYADREEGEAGAPWWPARRGGGAPVTAPVEAVDAASLPGDAEQVDLPASVRRNLSTTLIPQPDRPMPQAASAAPIISHEVSRPPRWNVGVRYRGADLATELLKSVDVHLDLAGWPGFGRIEPGRDGRRLEFRVDAIDLSPEKLHLEGTLTRDRPIDGAEAVQSGTQIELVAVPS